MSSPPPTAVPARRFRTLLIDDKPALRDLVRDVVEADGTFEVVGVAGDGRAGVEAARALMPDVILLDLAMPEMDGLQALPLLRRTCPDAKIVVFSGFQRAPLSASVLEGGAVGYIEKGANPYELRLDLLLTVGVLEQVDRALRTASFPADPRSVRSARTFVSTVLEGAHHDELVATVVLLTSELVTNAVAHASGDPQVVVQVLPGTVRVEVHDTSAERPTRREPDERGGRGLGMLDDLSDDWGVESRPGGKAVWFALDRPRATPEPD